METVTSIDQLESLLEAKTVFHDICFDELEWTEDLENLSFSNCHFNLVIFTGMDFESINFDNCEFRNCTFDSAKFDSCVFQKCKFYDGANDTGCSFPIA